MGQQQLLLLVLSTVIVGLATVAGIQAFSESQQQAAQDALVQRANSLASDIAAAANKPNQLGGVDLSESNDNIANAIGLSSASDIPAEGAGSDAACSITGGGSGTTATVNCGTTGATSGDVTVSVQVDESDEEDPVADPSITVTS
ncbi:MAG: hypothetical protein ABEK75_12835 [Salinibacter sp.]